MKLLQLAVAVVAVLGCISGAYATQLCSSAVLAARVGTQPTALPTTYTLNTLVPHFAPLTCSSSTFYPQQGEGTYVVGFNVTDPCSGDNTGGTATVTVTCSNRLPYQNVSVDWIWSPSSLPTVRLQGTVVACLNNAAGFWYVLSAPYASAYSAGQKLTNVVGLNGPSYFSVDVTLSQVGPYALQFIAYDNCAVYYRNLTIYWDGSLPHVLPPTDFYNTQCDGPLAPVKIASSPVKTAYWLGKASQFGISSISTVLTVRASAGDETVSYRWGLNTSDTGINRVVSESYSTTSSYYVIGNISSAATSTNSSYFISSVTTVSPTTIITGASPLSGTHKPFAGSPGEGMYQGTISRLGYLSREITVTTETNTSAMVYNVTAGTIVADQSCTVGLTWAASTSFTMNLAATVNIPATAPSATHWPYINAGAKCAGTYMLSVKTADGRLCSSSDYDWFMVDCGAAPNAVLSPCDAATINYQFSDRTWRWQGSQTVLDSTLSTDPSSRTPICCMQFNGVPSSSLLSGYVTCGYCNWAAFTPFTNWAPTALIDYPGTYTISLYSSNYCSSSKVTHTYTMTCDTYTITPGISPSSTSMNYDGTTGQSISVTLTSTTTSTATAAPVNGYISQVWSIDSQPTLSTWVSAYLLTQTGSATAGYLTSLTLANTNLVGRFAGSYVVKQTATHGCQQYGSTTQTITETCANDLFANPGSNQQTTDTCGTGYPAVTLSGGFNRTNAQANNYIVYWWSLDSVPTGSTWPTGVRINQQTFAFTPDVAGDFIFRLDIYDYCQVATSTVKVTAIYSPAAIADITITPSPSTYYSKSPITLTASLDATWSYSWNITSWPYGVATTSASASISSVTNVATFTAIPAGTYVVTVTITTTCGAKKSQTISMNVMCPYPLSAVVGGYVSGSGNSSTTTVVTWPENNNWRQVTLTGTATNYGSRGINNVTADWVVTSAPIDSIWAPLVNTTATMNFFETVVNSTYSLRRLVTRTVVTKTFSHVSPSSLAALEACFQPDTSGTYTIEMRLTDGCQASTAVITIIAACAAPPVAVINRKNALPPNSISDTGFFEIARSTDSSLRTTVPPSDGTRMYLDATSSYTNAIGASLSYYWTWLSPSTQAFTTQGIDPAYGPRILLSPPFPSNSTLILYVSDGCTITTARVLVSCGNDVSPSLSAKTVVGSVDPYSRTVPEFVISTGACYPQEATKWHVVSYTPSTRDFTMQAQSTTYNSATRASSVTAVMIAAVAGVIAMLW